MPYDEFLLWVSYFENRPIDWRSDLRAAYLMNVLGEKKKPQEIFPSLAVIFSKPKDNPLKGSYMLQKLLSAKGGDKLDILKDI
jgi:hypothetical protein